MLESKAMNERAYYTDSYTTMFQAAITERGEEDGRCFLVLDATYFYPTAGGQPSDRGTIEGIGIDDVVVRQGDGAILHYMERFPEGEIVTAVIDWQRRFDHMQQHSGQHVLSQAFIQVADAHTAGFHLSEESVTIDLDKENVSEATLAGAEALANQIVWQNRPIVVRWATREEAQALPLRKIPANGGERLRLIEIVDFDLTACGGTHVARTGEVGLIKITKQESRNKKTRIHFCCGERALAHYGSLNEVVLRLTTQLTTGAGELSASVRKLQDNEKEARRSLKQLQARLDMIEGEQLLGKAVAIGEDRLILHVFDGDEANKVRGLARSLARTERVIALFAVTGERTQLVFSRADDAAGSMKELLQIALQQLGSGSGGGNELFAQGAAEAAPAAEVGAALEAAAKRLSADGSSISA